MADFSGALINYPKVINFICLKRKNWLINLKRNREVIVISPDGFNVSSLARKNISNSFTYLTLHNHQLIV